MFAPTVATCAKLPPAADCSIAKPVSLVELSVQATSILLLDTALAVRLDGAASVSDAVRGRGPKTGAAWPYSNAPMSGAWPAKRPSFTFGRTAPASTALHPGWSVMTCAGMGTGGGPGTLKDVKQSSFETRMPCCSIPDAAVSDGMSGRSTPP